MKSIIALALALLIASHGAYAAETSESTGRDYNLSMAGALINNWCEQNWQDSTDISIHACRYKMSQLYNFTASSLHFEVCTEESRGDIVKIGECMVGQFNSWLGKEGLN